jgi:uncharacterized phosphosugar-binding protein
MTPTATARYIDVARELLDRVAEQDAELERAADICADAMMVFSAGGHGAVPIEVAKGARDRGLAVIAITSVAATVKVRTAAYAEHACRAAKVLEGVR